MAIVLPDAHPGLRPRASADEPQRGSGRDGPSKAQPDPGRKSGKGEPVDDRGDGATVSGAGEAVEVPRDRKLPAPRPRDGGLECRLDGHGLPAGDEPADVRTLAVSSGVGAVASVAAVRADDLALDLAHRGSTDPAGGDNNDLAHAMTSIDTVSDASHRRARVV